MFYEVVPTKIFRQGAGVLTYSSDLHLLPGHIVRIPLGHATVTGIVLRSVSAVDFPTKPIEKLLYDTPLPRHLLKALTWIAEYYLTPLPQVASLILPTGVEKMRRGKRPQKDGREEERTEEIPLNRAQFQALHALQSLHGTKLLHGITGSGKTNIYLSLAQETLKNGRSVIVLVPEISLTSQLVQIFCSTLTSDITLIHSRQTESERHQVWAEILSSERPRVIIGPRSALFAPVKNLGLIIIDEAHEPAYFQENPPKYSALRLASYIANIEKIDCLLGTATPLVTDYYLANQKSTLVTLSEKAKQTATEPDIHIINLADRQSFQKNRYFSDALLKSISRNLEHHHQTLIFHNRRGSAPLTICEHCGWQALCPHCLLPLTLHSDAFGLVCHTCGFTTTLPHSCPACGHVDIVHKGFGTKLLEAELHKLFKNAKIARFDADNIKDTTLDALYDEVKTGTFDIIIGTQTVARGLDLPNLATVGIVQADAGLSLPDYSAEERSFHLLTQVIGRVGRGHLDIAEVFIQTYQPDHPVITSAITADYAAFSTYLLKKRRAQHLPPYLYLARLTTTFKTEAITIKKIQALARSLQSTPGLTISSPTPAFHEQSSSGFTWQIIIKSTSRARILDAIKHLDPKLAAGTHLTLDPPSLL